MKQITYNTGSKGFSLVELMIAMLLGLILVGAATGVMLSNTQSYRATNDMAQIQDSARIGFELMARDILQAGSIPCGNYITVKNIISDAQNNPAWYLDWDGNGNGPAKGQLIGYADGDTLAGLSNRVAGTEALTVLYADNSGAILEDANKIYNDKHSFSTGDVALICNGSESRIFKATINGKKITAGTDNTTTLGQFEKNAVLSKLKSRAWYIGTNAQGDRSLYLAELTNSGLQLIEIASGIHDLQLEYRLNKNIAFTKTVDPSKWPEVNVVKITLEPHYENQPSSSDADRSFSSIVALRNRL